MKRIGIILLFLLVFNCKYVESPLYFSEDALSEKLITLKGEEITLFSILEENKENFILIDMWASWCRDCVAGMPKLKELQKEYPKVSYVFFSLDKNEKSWRAAIEKYKIEGKHYFMKSGMKGVLGNFVDLDWIPRYMLINGKKEIKIFKAVNAGDIKIKKALSKQQ